MFMKFQMTDDEGTPTEKYILINSKTIQSVEKAPINVYNERGQINISISSTVIRLKTSKNTYNLVANIDELCEQLNSLQLRYET